MITEDLVGALRAVVDRKVATNREWRVLAPVIEMHIRRAGRAQDLDDLRQSVYLKLLTTTSVVRANENGGAVRFLESVLAGVIKDRYRRAKVRPRAAKRGGHDDGDDPYARIAAPVPDASPTWDDQAALLEDLLDRVRGEVDERIADSGKSTEHRQSASNYAEATLMARVRNMDSKEIARALGVPDTKSDTIAKWVERGRPWVLDALDALATDATTGDAAADNALADAALSDEAQALAKLRDLVAKRRKDAGVARPERKRGGRR